MAIDVVKVCTNIQNGFTCVEVIPVVGVIGSALRVIFSLGELAVGHWMDNGTPIAQAELGLELGSLNFLLFGLPMFVVGILFLIDNHSPLTLYDHPI